VAKKKKIAQKDTGNYEVALFDYDGEFVVDVRYTGDWSGGEWVEVPLPEADAWVEKHVDHFTDEEVYKRGREWFAHFVRGDLDVAVILERHGFDKFTNRRGRR
jgi:hypothetical protein